MNLDQRCVQVGSHVAGIGLDDKLLNFKHSSPHFSGERTPEEAFPTSLQRLAECLRSLPCLFVADVGVADCRADILVAE